MPNCPITEWNETNCALDLPYLKKAYAKKLWPKVANYIRLQVLYEEGGIYLDTDIRILKPLDPLLEEECFLGFQLRDVGLESVNNAVLGARKRHPFLKACMELTLRIFETSGDFWSSPAVTTQVLREMGLRTYGEQKIDGIALYPVECFYPFSWNEKVALDHVGEQTYCIHYWTQWKQIRLKSILHRKIMAFRGRYRAKRRPEATHRSNSI